MHSILTIGHQVNLKPSKRDFAVQCSLLPAPPLHSKGYLENDAETEEEVESDEEYVLSPRPAHEDSSESEWYSCNRQCERLLLVFHYNFSPNATPVHLVNKYIVFEDCLLSLFNKCGNCGKATPDVTKTTIGTFLRVKQVCDNCESTREWDSQPFISNIPAGNILLSSSILFTGALPSQVLHVMDTLKCVTLSRSAFFSHQKKYLQPSILKVYKKHQSQLLSEIKKIRVGLIIGGDGRCDSPGHSAKYGSYTMMDLEKQAVVDIQLVQVRVHIYMY